MAGQQVCALLAAASSPAPGSPGPKRRAEKGPELRTVQSPRSHRRVPRQLAPGAPPTGAGLHSGAVRPRSPLGLSPASTTAQTDLRPSTPGLPLWCSERGTGQDCRASDAATPFPAPTSAAWSLLAPARRPSQGRQRHSRPTPPPLFAPQFRVRGSEEGKKDQVLNVESKTCLLEYKSFETICYFCT